MDVKPGVQTSEFWLSAIGGLAIAILALLVGYGFLTAEQSELWNGVIVAAAPIAIAAIVYAYNGNRKEIKVAALNGKE